MKVFLCDDTYDDILTAIYDAWETALSVGHEQVSIRKRPFCDFTLFDEVIEVTADSEKAEKVIRSVARKISPMARYWVDMALLHSDPDSVNIVYSFLRKGFRYGSSVCSRLNDPDIMKMMDMQRKVSGESYHLLEFARFNNVGNVYISHLEPIHNTLLMIADHFADRMPSENFILIDDNRRFAVVHPKDEENYIRYLTPEDFEQLAVSEKIEDGYTSMWRTYFDAIAIEERTNLRCQMSHFPKYKRKHATEWM
ncbi:MAG: TIGR03915 family putative DNA repair protein [Lachnospiraceae bacterium]|nr:TIGR03915 family putative DNA repair protein [Lachnospiraceae bacterium]